MITAENIFDNFKSTMSGLEKGLQVIHITTPADQLCCCQDDEEIAAVLMRSDLKPFDQIPVKQHETIIGLLKRRACPEGAKGAAGNYMQKLGESILVSADMPLLTFIENEESLDRIVISGTRIYGLVTKSDFLKLPVSLLGFAVVTHIEALLLNLIREVGISEETWLEWLEPKPHRRNEIERRFDDLSRHRSDLDMLELTYFSDKRNVLKHLIALEKYTPKLPDKSFIHQLVEIKKLRNDVAHTGNTADNDDNLQKFIDRLRDAHAWIDNIEQWQKARANNIP